MAASTKEKSEKKQGTPRAHLDRSQLRTIQGVVASDKVTVRHFPSAINRPPLRTQVLERERTRVLGTG